MSPENPNSTAVEEPGAKPTSETAPETAVQSSDSAPAQPTIDELQARLTRLEANVKGRTTELQREREEKERLRQQLDSLTRSRPEPPPPQNAGIEPEYENEADVLYTAVLEGDKKKIAGILKTTRERPVQQVAQMMQQLAAVQTQQQSLAQYLHDSGMKQGTGIYNDAMERIEAAKNDPKYAFAGGNPNWLASVIINEMRAEGKKSEARESVRQDNVDAAAGDVQKGGAPGAREAKAQKMYFTAAETAAIAKFARIDGTDIVTAQKKYWNNMDGRVRAARQEAGRA